jgi:hypothetical protein
VVNYRDATWWRAASQVPPGTIGAGPDEQNPDVLIGMAIGGGLLVVPAANVLAAFGN